MRAVLILFHLKFNLNTQLKICVCVCGGGEEKSSLDHFTWYLWLGELQSLVHLDVFKIEEDRLSLLSIDVVVNRSTYTPGFLETAHSFTHSHPKKSHLSTHKRFLYSSLEIVRINSAFLVNLSNHAISESIGRVPFFLGVAFPEIIGAFAWIKTFSYSFRRCTSTLINTWATSPQIYYPKPYK